MIALLFASFIWAQGPAESAPQAPTQNIPPSAPAVAPTGGLTATTGQAQIAFDPNNPFIGIDLPIKFIPTADGYSYDPTGLRNPFRPSNFSNQTITESRRSENNSSGDSGREVDQKLPGIERYDIGSYKVTAIIWNTASPKTLVLDPDGKTWMLKPQDRIGRNKGIVATIREGEVVVYEPAIEGEQPSSTLILTIKK